MIALIAFSAVLAMAFAWRLTQAPEPDLPLGAVIVLLCVFGLDAKGQ